jgi:hypothetical protein
MITNCYTVLSLMKEGSQGYARYILQADVWAALGFSSMRAGMTNNVNYEQIASCTSPCVSFGQNCDVHSYTVSRVDIRHAAYTCVSSTLITAALESCGG